MYETFSLHFIIVYKLYHEDVRECDDILASLSISALGESEFTLLVLYTLDKGPDTHWIGGWMGPTAGMHAVGKRKTSCPCLERNSISLVVQPSSSSP
jgi:hypothetical protein